MVNSMFGIAHQGRSGGGAGAPSNNSMFSNSIQIRKTEPRFISRNANIFYNFNLKIQFITQTLNQIMYHDREYPVDAMRNQFNVLLYQLGRLKEDEILSGDGYNTTGTGVSGQTTRYNTVLFNAITTFDALVMTYDTYVRRMHDLFILLPNDTYTHIYYLKEFVKQLREETVIDQPTDPNIDQINQSLEALLVSLYDNVGSDINALLDKFSQGRLADIKDELTYELFTNLSSKLFEQQNSTSTGYTRAYDALILSLTGLYKSAILERSHADEVKRLYDQLTLCRDNRGSGMLEGTATMSEPGVIRPEIMQYISRHGFPAGAVFDPVKLTEVINDLGMT